MKYFVHFSLYASKVVEVEADNEDQAREKAEENFEPVCLCHQCAHDVEIGDVGEIVAVTECGE